MAQLQVDRDRGHHDERREGDDGLGPAQDETAGLFVEPEQHPADRMFFFLVIFADANRSQQPR